MSLSRLIEIIKSEVDAESADRIQSRLAADLSGVWIRIPRNKTARVTLTYDSVTSALREGGWAVEIAAEKLGCSPDRLYKYLARPKRQIQFPRSKEIILR